MRSRDEKRKQDKETGISRGTIREPHSQSYAAVAASNNREGNNVDNRDFIPQETMPFNSRFHNVREQNFLKMQLQMERMEVQLQKLLNHSSQKDTFANHDCRCLNQKVSRPY